MHHHWTLANFLIHLKRVSSNLNWLFSVVYVFGLILNIHIKYFILKSVEILFFKDVILIIRLLRDWYPNIFLRQRNDIERVTAMLLQDLYVYPEIVLDHRPRTLAVAVSF